MPDLLFILDLDTDTALARIGGRGDETNEFEKREDLELCRGIFLSLKGEPFVRVIDASRSMDEVQDQLVAETTVKQPPSTAYNDSCPNWGKEFRPLL